MSRLLPRKILLLGFILVFAFFIPSAKSPALQTPAQGTCFIYPSPATGATAWVVYTMPQGGTATLSIYTEAGDLAAEDVETLSAGLQQTALDLTYYHTGVYFCRVILRLDDGTTQRLPLFKFAVVR
jgi:hypothetical protein